MRGGVARFINITPAFSVSDLDRSLAFYCDTLGFVRWAAGEGYAYVSLGRAGIRLLQRGPDDAVIPAMAYIDLDDVDGFVADRQTAIAALPEDRVTPLCDQFYNQREFGITDPDGNQLFFGEGIGPNADQWNGWPRY